MIQRRAEMSSRASVGGAPIPPAIGEAFAAKGFVVAPSYGMTEAGSGKVEKHKLRGQFADQQFNALNGLPRVGSFGVRESDSNGFNVPARAIVSGGG